jgi:quinoprotein glucose dehydrogenase
MNADRNTPGQRWSPAGLAALAGRILYGLTLMVAGITLSVGGARLLTLGGSAYYLPAGLAAASAGGLVLLRRWSLAAKIYLALVLISALWGLWESGLNGWALAPRVLSPAVLGLPFFVLALARGERRERLACLGLAAGAVALAAAATLSSSYHPVPAAGDPQHTEVATLPANDWPYFGGSPGGNHFTALDQITPRNVGELKVAWSTVVGPAPRAKYMLNQAVPLKIGDHLYTCLPFGNVYELDPETGKMRWSFHAKSDTTGAYQAKCRGLAYYAVPKATGPCAQRLNDRAVHVGLDGARSAMVPDQVP